jgi:hypothetical protein
VCLNAMLVRVRKFHGSFGSWPDSFVRKTALTFSQLFDGHMF